MAIGGIPKSRRAPSQDLVRVPRRVFHHLLPERPTPERCVEAYYLQRTRFENIAERKLRQRQLTEDGNVEISGICTRAKSYRSPSLPQTGAVDPLPNAKQKLVSGAGC